MRPLAARRCGTRDSHCGYSRKHGIYSLAHIPGWKQRISKVYIPGGKQKVPKVWHIYNIHVYVKAYRCTAPDGGEPVAKNGNKNKSQPYFSSLIYNHGTAFFLSVSWPTVNHRRATYHLTLRQKLSSKTTEPHSLRPRANSHHSNSRGEEEIISPSGDTVSTSPFQRRTFQRFFESTLTSCRAR